MRLEQTSGGEIKVWMTDDEIDTLRRYTTSLRDEIIIDLGAYVGLRSFEIPQVCPFHVKDRNNGHYHLRVPEGKDTTGHGGKPRDAYLPSFVERKLHQHQNRENIAPRQPFVDLKPRGVRAVVRRVADRAADETGDTDFNHVSSHDLRSRFAQRLLVDYNANPRVVMSVGGWDSLEAIKPYLNAPTADVVDSEFEKINFDGQ